MEMFIYPNKKDKEKQRAKSSEWEDSNHVMIAIFVSLWSYWVPTMSQGPCQLLYLYYLKSSLQTGEMEIVILMLLMKLSHWKLKYLGENSRRWQSKNSSMPVVKASISSSQLHFMCTTTMDNTSTAANNNSV